MENDNLKGNVARDFHGDFFIPINGHDLGYVP